MSNGTLQQLASKGVQDGHLSISPETSFFKRTYKRVSNYAIESIDQQVPSIAWDKSFVVQMSRNGDLLAELWLVMDIKLCRLNAPGADTVHWANALGHAMLKDSSLEIGNNTIDSVTGLYLEIKHELESTIDIDTNELVYRSNNANQLINWTNNGNTKDLDGAAFTQIYVKLPFYFAKARSQALPVIALQYHDIRVKFTLRSKDDLLVFSNAANKTLNATNNGDINTCYLMANFVYLDTMERRLFASNAHEYLLKNIQVSDFHTKAAGAGKMHANVTFNHPVTVFYWVVQKQTNIDANDYFNYELTTGLGDDPLLTATITFNGSKREKERGPLYWRKIVPGLYFQRTPRKNLYCYSFAQHPSTWYPSGSVNLSRIDNCALDFVFATVDANGVTYGAAEVSIICENFNVIRIQGGMAAKKYANLS